MHFTSAILSACALLSTFANGAALFTGNEHEITKLHIHKPGNRAGDKWTLVFIIHDPDPLTDSSAFCSTSWKKDEAPFPSYQACSDPSFDFQLKNFASIQDFRLETKHTFKDPSVGQPPQDRVTTFARGHVTGKNLTCTASRPRQGRTCKEKTGKDSINLQIYAAIA